MTTADNRLLTGKELANYLGVSMFFISAHKEIPRVHVGKKLVRYELDSVLEFLRAQK